MIRATFTTNKTELQNIMQMLDRLSIKFGIEGSLIIPIADTNIH